MDGGTNGVRFGEQAVSQYQYQNTVVGVMNKSREEAGFDAAQYSLFPYSISLFNAFSWITMVVCCVKGDNKKIRLGSNNRIRQ